MTTNEIVKLIKKYKPTSAVALRRLGFKLKGMGTGLYRKTYSIIGFGLVIKFNVGWDNGEHAYNEIKVIKRILRYDKYKPLRKYVPKIYWFDRKTGTTLVQQYEKMRNSRRYKKAMDTIDTKAYNILKAADDLHSANFAIERSPSGKEQLKIIDWGLCV